MPMFEYRCGKCGSEFEELVLGDGARVKCPSCGSARVKKLMSAFAHKSGEKFVSSSGGGCSGCSKTSCSSCK